MKGFASRLPSHSFPKIIALLCPSPVKASILHYTKRSITTLKMLFKIPGFALLLLPATILVTHARNIRRDDPETVERDGAIFFAPNYATCSDSDYLSVLKETKSVQVQNQCDLAIETVCTRAVADFKKARNADSTVVNSTNMEPSSAQVGETYPCEATILYSQPKLSTPLILEDCIASFQSITIECMLLEDWTKHASVGNQGGVRNVIFTPGGGDVDSRYPMWKANNVYNSLPGYMVGPAGWFAMDTGYQFATDISGT
ncbi:MAG: hypothetical protein Q9197_000777 [Variospora fuerteventurae]